MLQRRHMKSAKYVFLERLDALNPHMGGCLVSSIWRENYANVQLCAQGRATSPKQSRFLYLSIEGKSWFLHNNKRPDKGYYKRIVSFHFGKNLENRGPYHDTPTSMAKMVKREYNHFWRPWRLIPPCEIGKKKTREHLKRCKKRMVAFQGKVPCDA